MGIYRLNRLNRITHKVVDRQGVVLVIGLESATFQNGNYFAMLRSSFSTARTSNSRIHCRVV